MINNLNRTGVRTTAHNEDTFSYTPTQPVKIAYCGTRNSSDNILNFTPTSINSEDVVFRREQIKLNVIQNSIANREGLPGFQNEGTLALYRWKSQRKYVKITNVDKSLQEMVRRKSRTNGELTIYVFIIQTRQEGAPENRQEGAPENRQEGAPENRNILDVQADIDHRDQRTYQLGEADDDDPFNGRMSPMHDVVTTSNGEDLNSESILDSQFGLAESPPSRTNPIEVRGSPRQGSETLPEIGFVRWREIPTLPPGEITDIGNVVEPDLKALPKLIKQIKTKSTLKCEESMETDEGPTETHPSEWSENKLLEKCLTLVNDFEVFTRESELSTELLTQLVLVSATETQNKVHVVTAEEVENIPAGINPFKPADDVDKIIILKLDENLTFIAVVNNVVDFIDETNDYFLDTIVVHENSKHYWSNLIAKDVCTKMNIYVKDNMMVYKNFLGFNFGEEEELPFLSFLLLSARELMGLSTHYSLDHLRAIVEDIHERAKKSKTTQPHPVDSNAEVDLFPIN